MPPRNKKPLFSRTSELKNRALRRRTGSPSKNGSTNCNNYGNTITADVASVRDQGVVVLVRIRPTSQSEQGQRCFLQVRGATQVRINSNETLAGLYFFQRKGVFRRRPNIFIFEYCPFPFSW